MCCEVYQEDIADQRAHERGEDYDDEILLQNDMDDDWDDDYDEECDCDDDYDDDMDGDFDTGMRDAGFGTNEDYGDFSGGEDW